MIAPYLPGGAATVPRPCTGQILAMFAQSFRRLAVVALLGLGLIGASNAQQLVRVGSTPTGKPEHDCVRLQRSDRAFGSPRILARRARRSRGSPHRRAPTWLRRLQRAARRAR